MASKGALDRSGIGVKEHYGQPIFRSVTSLPLGPLQCFDVHKDMEAICGDLCVHVQNAYYEYSQIHKTEQIVHLCDVFKSTMVPTFDPLHCHLV